MHTITCMELTQLYLFRQWKHHFRNSLSHSIPIHYGIRIYIPPLHSVLWMNQTKYLIQIWAGQVLTKWPILFFTSIYCEFASQKDLNLLWMFLLNFEKLHIPNGLQIVAVLFIMKWKTFQLHWFTEVSEQ